MQPPVTTAARCDTLVRGALRVVAPSEQRGCHNRGRAVLFTTPGATPKIPVVAMMAGRTTSTAPTPAAAAAPMPKTSSITSVATVAAFATATTATTAATDAGAKKAAPRASDWLHAIARLAKSPRAARYGKFAVVLAAVGAGVAAAVSAIDDPGNERPSLAWRVRVLLQGMVRFWRCVCGARRPVAAAAPATESDESVAMAVAVGCMLAVLSAVYRYILWPSSVAAAVADSRMPEAIRRCAEPQWLPGTSCLADGCPLLRSSLTRHCWVLRGRDRSITVGMLISIDYKWCAECARHSAPLCGCPASTDAHGGRRTMLRYKEGSERYNAELRACHQRSVRLGPRADASWRAGWPMGYAAY